VSLPRAITFVRFAGAVLGLKLTAAQRVLAKVAFDSVDPERLDGEERELARVMFAVDTVPELARRLLVLRLGRGSGKTTLAAAYALYVMLFGDVSACGPGDVPVVVTVSPTKRTAGISVRMGRELVRGVPALERLVDSETTEGFTIRRSDGRLVQFAVFAASRGGASARGLSILTFILDEAEFFASADEFTVNDRDVFRALIPRLKGKGIFIGTPWPVPTLMGELFDQNFGNPTTALAAKAPSMMMRPDDADLAAAVAMERARSPEDAAREFDCDVTGIAGSSLLFDVSALDECKDPTIVMPERALPGARVGAGVDLGLARDSAALVVSGKAETLVRILSVTELRPQRGAPLKLSEVIATFAETTRRYQISRWCADSYVREPAREYTDCLGIAIHPAPTEQSARADTWLHAKKLVLEHRLRLPPPPCPLLAQLKTVIAKPTNGGAIAITIPRRRDVGRHGDLAAAAILSLHEVNARRPGWGIGQNSLLNF
jgi:hypothetical protein